jgi:hypothetical protein
MHVSPTLRELGKEWMVALAKAETFALVIGVALEFTAALIFRDSSYLAIGAALGLLGTFAFGFICWLAFYNLLRCPACQAKLNRFKNGNRVPSKQAHAELKNGSGCRHCGWKPAA